MSTIKNIKHIQCVFRAVTQITLDTSSNSQKCFANCSLEKNSKKVNISYIKYLNKILLTMLQYIVEFALFYSASSTRYATYVYVKRLLRKKYILNPFTCFLHISFLHCKKAFHHNLIIINYKWNQSSLFPLSQG